MSENFDEKQEAIFQEIKETFLSKNSFPKLIIGRELSISVGMPEVKDIAKELNEEMQKSNLKSWWNKHYNSKKNTEDLIKELEQFSLSIPHSHTSDEKNKKINYIISNFLITKEKDVYSKIFKNNKVHGFEKLLEYLSKTVSSKLGTIDIMTINQDRVIELFCDKLGLTTSSGFSGNLNQFFNQYILKNPWDFFAKKEIVIKLLKPYGSINWIKKNGKEYQINGLFNLEEEMETIIVPPFANLYKAEVLLSNEFVHYHFKIFENIIKNSNKNFSFLIYGYSFDNKDINDLLKNINTDFLILAKKIENDFIETLKIKSNLNFTLLYKNKDLKNIMIHKCRIHKYEEHPLEKEMWNIDVFSKEFLA